MKLVANAMLVLLAIAFVFIGIPAGILALLLLRREQEHDECDD